ncbi:hypothetical protein CS8_012910 [Cupriavidus sp. 8B]
MLQLLDNALVWFREALVAPGRLAAVCIHSPDPGLIVGSKDGIAGDDRGAFDRMLGVAVEFKPPPEGGINEAWCRAPHARRSSVEAIARQSNIMPLEYRNYGEAAEAELARAQGTPLVEEYRQGTELWREIIRGQCLLDQGYGRTGTEKVVNNHRTRAGGASRPLDPPFAMVRIARTPDHQDAEVGAVIQGGQRDRE